MNHAIRELRVAEQGACVLHAVQGWFKIVLGAAGDDAGKDLALRVIEAEAAEFRWGHGQKSPTRPL